MSFVAMHMIKNRFLRAFKDGMLFLAEMFTN